MPQKVMEIVGASKESFAKAAENAITEAAKTVRGMKWARRSPSTARQLASILT